MLSKKASGTLGVSLARLLCTIHTDKQCPEARHNEGLVQGLSMCPVSHLEAGTRPLSVPCVSSEGLVQGLSMCPVSHLEACLPCSVAVIAQHISSLASLHVTQRWL